MGLDPWYVTGLAEGEGTFTFSRSGPHLALYFGLKLTGLDRGLLQGIQDYFKVGSLYAVKARAPSSARQGFTKSATYFRVTRLDELPAVIAHFTRYPMYGSKQRSFEIWRTMVELKISNFRRPPRDELEALARQLSASSPRNQPWDGPTSKGLS